MPRRTQQREAIRTVFQVAHHPLSHEEILARAQDNVPGMGIATVYRNVKRFVEEGWVREVPLPGMVPRYERAGRPHHHHFVCRKCDQAFDIPGCPEGVEGLAPPGFQVEDHEVILYGLCPDCR